MNKIGEDLVIERKFALSLKVVWKAWIDCNEAKKWWGPKGFSSPYCAIDLKVGGKYLFCMRSSDGKDIWSTGIYEKIEPLSRLTMTDSFADEKGNVVPASHYGMSSVFPLEMTITVTFRDFEGGTKLTLRHMGFPESELAGARQGWSESFDKLAELYGTK